MTPATFWGTLFNNIIDFIYHLYGLVYTPLISFIVSNPIILLIFGIIITYSMVEVFLRLR